MCMQFTIFLYHCLQVTFFQFPEHGLYGLEDKILLFRHDPKDPNLLKHMTSISDVIADTLIEVVLSGKLSALLESSRCRFFSKINCFYFLFKDYH